MTDQWLGIVGAGAFGAIIGWYVYYINRYRRSEVQFSDLTTVIGIIGGGAVLALFRPETPLFGAYGTGLFLGFFAYFLALVVLVRVSPNFSADFFLDGRRKTLAEDDFIPGEFVSPIRPPMQVELQPGAPRAQAMELRFDHGQQPVVVRMQPAPGGNGARELAPETPPRDAAGAADELRAAIAEAKQVQAALAEARRTAAPAE